MLVDVKTVSPEPIDRWDQFAHAREAGWIRDGFDLSTAWMGGELWHSASTARARMLEYTLELEAKLPRYKVGLPNVFAVLAFCGNGFSWRLDELEDFASFYFSRRHRSDDLFGPMELHHVNTRNIHLVRSINRFAYFERAPNEVDARVACWDVQPPEDSALT